MAEIATIRPSPYGTPERLPESQRVKKKSFLSSAFSGKAIGGSLKGFAKGFAFGGFAGGTVGAIAGGIKGAADDQAANRAALAGQDVTDYDQLVQQRAMNRKRAALEGLSGYYGAQSADPKYLRASKLGDPITLPTFDPRQIYGTDTTDWQVPATPAGRQPAWWEGVGTGVAEGVDAYMSTKPQMPTSGGGAASGFGPSGFSYRSSPMFNVGSFDYRNGGSPSFMPVGQRAIRLGGGSSYVPATRRSYF